MEHLEVVAVLVGYAILLSGGLALALYIFWWLVGKVLKQMGYWPMFIQGLYQVAKQKREKKELKNEANQGPVQRTSKRPNPKQRN